MSVSRKRKELAPVVVVEDFGTLDADIADYIAKGATSSTTREVYKKRWRQWRTHCVELHVDPWDAPASAFEDLWLRRTQAGDLYDADTVDGIASAVKYYYEFKSGDERTPAYKLPQNAVHWRELRRAAIKREHRDEAERHGHEDDDTRVVPLMRSDVVAMLAAPLPWTPEQLARKAAMLLYLDRVSPAVLDRLTRDNVNLGAGGSITVAGRQFPCDHQPRVAGVPWDCTACAVREVALGVAPGQTLLDDGTTGRRINTTGAWRRRFRHLAPAGRPGGPREGLTEWELAGLRRAVVLWSCGSSSQSDLGLRWVRARAWVAVAWSCGLRMGADTYRLDRAAARPDAQGRGWSLSLGATKDDPGGAKNVVRPFEWPAAHTTVSVAAALAEYACVRDALVGADGPLITDLGSASATRRAKRADTTAGVAKDDLSLLAGLAGLEPVYTSYSTRKGYAAQAVEDGWTVEQIRDGLRHLHLTTTLAHYLPKVHGREVSRKFIDKLATTDGNAA